MKEFFKRKRVKWSLIGLGGIVGVLVVLLTGRWGYMNIKYYVTTSSFSCDTPFSGVNISAAEWYCKNRC